MSTIRGGGGNIPDPLRGLYRTDRSRAENPGDTCWERFTDIFKSAQGKIDAQNQRRERRAFRAEVLQAGGKWEAVVKKWDTEAQISGPGSAKAKAFAHEMKKVESHVDTWLAESRGPRVAAEKCFRRLMGPRGQHSIRHMPAGQCQANLKLLRASPDSKYDELIAQLEARLERISSASKATKRQDTRRRKKTQTAKKGQMRSRRRRRGPKPGRSSSPPRADAPSTHTKPASPGKSTPSSKTHRTQSSPGAGAHATVQEMFKRMTGVSIERLTPEIAMGLSKQQIAELLKALAPLQEGNKEYQQASKILMDAVSSKIEAEEQARYEEERARAEAAYQAQKASQTVSTEKGTKAGLIATLDQKGYLSQGSAPIKQVNALKDVLVDWKIVPSGRFGDATTPAQARTLSRKLQFYVHPDTAKVEVDRDLSDYVLQELQRIRDKM